MNYTKLLKENNINTPCFLIDTEIIGELSDEITSALKKYWKNGIVGYSFKTNNLPWLISFFKEKGFYAEVVSSDEFDLALEMGYPCNKIIFNGPVKDKCTFEKALKNGSIVNIDSQRELMWLKNYDVQLRNEAAVGLRVNFCIEDYCRGESQCGDEDGRFGFSYERGELKKAIEFLKENQIKLNGLHLHCSSKTRSLNIYKAIANVAKKIIDEYGLDLNYVDIGGGYFGGLPDKPTFDEYFSAVYEILKPYSNIILIIEPGMSVVGAGIDYITSVVDIKQTLNNSFAVLDGSRIHIDPIKRKKTYSYEIVGRNRSDQALSEDNTILCGFTCMEDDRFISLKNTKINIGDNIIFHKVGAYTMGLSAQFIEFYPLVYQISNNEIKIVRKKVTAKDFVELNKEG